MEDLYNKASLVLTPQMVEAGKVYSMKPEDRKGDFTFSRSTAATRVNASGNIEKETGNLLLQSNNFDTSWDKVGVSLTSGQSGYDGSNDAWLLTKTAASYERVRQNNTSSGVLTISVYAKANTLNQATIYCFTSGSNAYAQFSLVDGSVVDSSSIIDSSATNIGNGWWRLSITFNDTLQSINIYPDFAESNAGSIYIQDAQLEQGLVARDVITTTTTAIYGGITDNVPRLDYTDSSCPALLLEPQRTNLIGNSEYFGAWTNTESSTLTPNDTESPEGVDNAYEHTPTTTNAYHRISNNFSTTSGTTYTASLFVKANGYDYFLFRIGSIGGVYHNASFDLSDGSVDYLSSSLDSSAVENYGNGWYRLKVTFTADQSATTIGVRPQPTSITSNSIVIYQGDGTSGSYIFGAQAEQGSYATSYIPTYGSAVTRNEDDTTITNLQSNNIAGDTFSYFFEWGDYVADRNFEIRDSSNTNFFFMVSRLFRYNNESGGVDSLMILPTSGTALKCMVTYDGTTLKGFVNGALEGSVTDAKASQFSDFNYLRLDRDHPDSEELRSLMIFPTALTDQEAIDLTTI